MMKFTQSNKILARLNNFSLQNYCFTEFNLAKILILTLKKLKLFDWMNRKIFCAGICFFIFLYIGFFYLSINKVSAVNLEVNYPVISGQDINADANLTLPSYVKYLFNAGVFLGFFAVFISLLVAGVMYFLSPINAEFLSSAKDRVFGAISGLLILTLTYLIITTINPQLSIFNLNAMPPTPPPAPTQAPGVYFYKSAKCSDKSVQPNVSDILDLGPLKNNVNSVGVIQNPDTQTAYITILYENTNLWGKCQYITTDISNPEQTCKDVSPFSSSASIYGYNYNPNGEGVFFFRKSCFNINGQNYYDVYGNYDASFLINYCKQNSGGYYEVTNQNIIDAGGIYTGKLEDLQFVDPYCSNDPNNCCVPEEEKDCIEYDNNGKCTQKECPTLEGENISSMIIDGNYLVLFVYFKPGDDPKNGPWTYCQEFPLIDDANKLGPQQIKWQNIRNSGGVIPNFFVIIPIQGRTILTPAPVPVLPQ